MKKRWRQSRVSWASGVNLCQVKIFLSEDCPSKVGNVLSSCQDPVKPSLKLPSIALKNCDRPPGFNGCRDVFDKLQIHQITWKCPPKFSLSNNWHVLAGEESEEKETQTRREMRVIEAFYPRNSDIPSSPRISFNTQLLQDDSLTPIVPLIPIEEEEEEATVIDSPVYPQSVLPSGSLTIPPLDNVPDKSETATNGILHGFEQAGTRKTAHKVEPATKKGAADALPDYLRAAETAVTALVKSEEQGSLIDTDLLVKIFNDPVMIQKLMKDFGSSPMNVNTAVQSISATEQALVSTQKPKMVFPPSPATASQATETKMHCQTSNVPLLIPLGNSELPQTRVEKGNFLSKPNQMDPISPIVPVQTCIVPGASSSTAMNCLPPQVGQVETKLPNLFRVPTQSVSSAPISSSTLVNFPLGPVAMASPSLHAQPYNVHAPNQIEPGLHTLHGQTGQHVKDIEYMKNLIRKHGTEREVAPQVWPIAINNNNQNYEMSLNQKEVRPKIQKACLYFRSAMGCRYGESCRYVHDLSNQWTEGVFEEGLGPNNAKRMKLRHEISGRT